MASAAAQVYSGNQGGRADNSGGAFVLDHHPDFLPYAQRMLEVRNQERKLQQAQQKQTDKDWLTLQKSFDPSGVQLRDEKQLMGKLKGFNDELVKLKLDGFDPTDYYGKGGERARQIEVEAKNLKKASLENQAAREGLVTALEKDPTLDRAHALEWMKKYDALPTIEEQQKFRMDNNPLQQSFSPNEVLDRVVPVAFEITTDNGTKKITKGGIDRDKFKKAFMVDLNTQQGQQDFMAWQSRNPDKTEDDYIEFMSDHAGNTVKDVYKEDVIAPRSSGGSGGSASDKLSFSVSQDGTTGLIQDGKPNKLRVNRTGTQDDLPAIGVTDDSGKLIDFQPIEFIVGDNGKIGVKGYKVEKGGGGTKINADGSVQIGGSASQPEEVWIDYDSNKDAFKAQLLGEDIYEKLGRTRGSEKQSESTPKMSEAEWSASWAKLKPGQSMMGLDGKKYVKK